MKKITLLVLAFSLLASIALTSCKKAEEQAAPATDQPAMEDQAPAADQPAEDQAPAEKM